MITPDFLNEIIRKTEEKAAQLNNYLVQKIAARIEAAFYRDGTTEIIPASINDLHKLTRQGLSVKEIEDAVAAAAPDISDAVHEAFLTSAGEIAAYNLDFAKKAVQFANEQGALYDVKVPKYEQVGIPKSAQALHMTPDEVRVLEAAYKRTNGEIRNLTRTAGVAANDIYVNACDTAFWKAKHGVSLNQAIVEAIDEVAAQGITVVNYGGRKDKIDVAIARAVRTGINQANAEIVLTRCAEMGVNYIKVSEHVGARVTPFNDYTNHSYWQGKVYSVNWNDPALKDFNVQSQQNTKGFVWLNKIKEFFTKLNSKQYPDFVTETGYGKIEGLCGVNCRHTFSPFCPDFQKDTGSKIDPKENEQRYRKEQQARAMERAIRQTKREIDALEGLDTDEANAKRKELKQRLDMQAARYREFMNKNKLSQANWRLYTG